MSRRLHITALASLVLSLSIGCGDSGPTPINAKKVIPVTGVVHVDGSPAERVRIKLHPSTGLDKTNPTASSAMTGADGKFAVTTYYQGDGAPPGEYRLTFQQIINTAVKPAPDELGGAYSNPAASTITVTVPEEGEGVNMGTIELSTE